MPGRPTTRPSASHNPSIPPPATIQFRHISTATVWLCQLATGLTLLFSSFTKANDPLGMTIMLQDYLMVAGIHTGYASVPVTACVILLTFAEAAIGISLLMGACRRRTAWLLLLFMAPMLIVTAVNAATDAVPECGCFGSAIHLTNTESFLKNIVLTLAAVWLFIRHDSMYRLGGRHLRAMVANIVVVSAVILALWSWRNLPPVDFTPYKTGTDILSAMMGEYDVVNGQSVEIKAPTILDFGLTDEEGNDRTDEILMAEKPVTLITIPSAQAADTGNADRLNALWDEARDKGEAFYIVMAEGKEAAEYFKDCTGLGCPALYASLEMLQTIVRANPGIVRITAGQITEKSAVSNL